MILLGYSWIAIAKGIGWTSLIALVVVTIYKQLLRSLSKGSIDKADYCELYSLEIEPASGELPFYFTSEKAKEVALLLLDHKMDLIQEIVKKECKVGGNIVRFDSTKIPNGDYFYCLKTENQKVVKKMRVLNV
jgi:hypothetical protein